MALVIKESNGIVVMEGNINNTTVKQFKNHLEFLLLYRKALTVNINDIKNIDKQGLDAIKYLFAKALSFNKKFDVTGYGCKDIYVAMHLDKVV